MSEQELAARYRRWLRVYPRSWRAEREEEVLGVLLDAAAEDGRVRPSRRDVGDLVVHGLAARVGVVLPAPAVRSSVASTLLVVATAGILAGWGLRATGVLGASGWQSPSLYAVQGLWVVAAVTALLPWERVWRSAFRVAGGSAALIGVLSLYGNDTFLTGRALALALVAWFVLRADGLAPGRVLVPSTLGLSAVMLGSWFAGDDLTLWRSIQAFLFVGVLALLGAAVVALAARRWATADGVLIAAWWLYVATFSSLLLDSLRNWWWWPRLFVLEGAYVALAVLLVLIHRQIVGGLRRREVAL